MYDIARDLLDAYKTAPDIYVALLQGCTQERALASRGGDEDWSVVEVVCHLRDAEQRALERMRLMRDSDNPPLPAYDQAAWAVERNYAGENLHAALSEFLRLRAEHVKELSELTPDQWNRTGMHSDAGEVTIAMQTLHHVSHDTQHAAQIVRQLRAI